MLVTTEEHMQSIISSRKDLEWEGWNVVKYTKSNSAMFSADGCIKGGQWMNKKVFLLTEHGWNLPESIGRKYAQVEG